MTCGYGANPDGGFISVHHNLFAHNSHRNPSVREGFADIPNNVTYNVGGGIDHDGRRRLPGRFPFSRSKPDSICQRNKQTCPVGRGPEGVKMKGTRRGGPG